MKRNKAYTRRDLDLHGVKHADVDALVENHVLMSEPPLSIITGHSGTMKRIVISVLDRHGYKYIDGLPHNNGCIVVL